MRVIAFLVGLCLAAPAAAQTIGQFVTTPVTGLVQVVNQSEPPATSTSDMTLAIGGADVTPEQAAPGQGTPVPSATPATPSAPSQPAATPPAPKNRVAKELSAQVEQLAGRRDFDKAIVLITQALAGDGNNAELYRLRATMHCRAMRMKPCLEDADKAVQADDDYVPAHIFRALVRVDVGQAKDGIADCQTAIRVWSTRPFGYNCLGVVHRAMRDFAAAITDFDTALSKDPKFALSHYNKGLTYALDKKPDEAIASFSAAIAIDEKYDEAIAQRGKVLVGKGDLAAARSDFTKALGLNAKNGAAIIGIQALQVAKALDTLTHRN